MELAVVPLNRPQEVSDMSLSQSIVNSNAFNKPQTQENQRQQYTDFNRMWNRAPAPMRNQTQDAVGSMVTSLAPKVAGKALASGAAETVGNMIIPGGGTAAKWLSTLLLEEGVNSVPPLEYVEPRLRNQVPSSAPDTRTPMDTPSTPRKLTPDQEQYPLDKNEVDSINENYNALKRRFRSVDQHSMKPPPEDTISSVDRETANMPVFGRGWDPAQLERQTGSPYGDKPFSSMGPMEKVEEGAKFLNPMRMGIDALRKQFFSKGTHTVAGIDPHKYANGVNSVPPVEYTEPRLSNQIPGSNTNQSPQLAMDYNETMFQLKGKEAGEREMLIFDLMEMGFDEGMAIRIIDEGLSLDQARQLASSEGTQNTVKGPLAKTEAESKIVQATKLNNANVEAKKSLTNHKLIAENARLEQELAQNAEMFQLDKAKKLSEIAGSNGLMGTEITMIG